MIWNFVKCLVTTTLFLGVTAESEKKELSYDCKKLCDLYHLSRSDGPYFLACKEEYCQARCDKCDQCTNGSMVCPGKEGYSSEEAYLLVGVIVVVILSIAACVLYRYRNGRPQRTGSGGQNACEMISQPRNMMITSPYQYPAVYQANDRAF